ncbi:MAG: hypothetical protein AVDCRST_MAG02-1395 [uncultured Rubrobacteraceae bacterium]|uniref:Uncharacterized protein n=1 Tax=uncultured Rubrobacteraceae bacterium TaxID=349277 RepID=A0A6J4R3I3_9ACTN|nr:MAG: hypothetical protein AVDCRST_MAG02-1395 [uncultured Rubrobacteraceae bacterium]
MPLGSITTGYFSLLLLQPRLLEDAVECTGGQFVARFAWYGNETGLVGMLVLTMAAFGPRPPPTVLLDRPDGFANFRVLGYPHLPTLVHRASEPGE